MFMDTFEPELPQEDTIPEQETAPEQEQMPPVQESTPTPPQGVPYGYIPWGYIPAQPYQQPVPPQSPKPEKKKKGGCFVRLVSGFVIAGLVFSNLLMGLNIVQLRQEIQSIRKNSEENLSVIGDKIDEIKGGNGNSVSGTPNTSPDGLTPGQVYAQNADSVVAINCSVGSSYGQMVSAGSGFIWSEDGYIVSNFHVVDGADSITVVTNDGTKYAAKLVGGDSSNDISLLKVEAQGLKPVTVGQSSDLIVGDQVAAIGNPLGKLASTLTVGYVSAMDRIVTTEGSQINMIQTDAAINSGNSGGPLFNMHGQVIGITTAKYSGTSNSGASIEGIGFAIPMDDVLGMLEDLRDHGYITGGYLGVEVTNMSETDAKLYGLPMGVLVHKVTPGTCAEKGGILARDILVELGGHTVENTNDLTRALRQFDGGDTVTAVVYRASAGGEVVLTLTLDHKPAPASSNEISPLPEEGSADAWFDYFFGE